MLDISTHVPATTDTRVRRLTPVEIFTVDTVDRMEGMKVYPSFYRVEGEGKGGGGAGIGMARGPRAFRYKSAI